MCKHARALQKDLFSLRGFCRGHDSATKIPCQESSSVPAWMGQQLKAALLGLPEDITLRLTNVNQICHQTQRGNQLAVRSGL